MEPFFRTSQIRYYWSIRHNGYTPYIAGHLKPRAQRGFRRRAAFSSCRGHS